MFLLCFCALTFYIKAKSGVFDHRNSAVFKEHQKRRNHKIKNNRIQDSNRVIFPVPPLPQQAGKYFSLTLPSCLLYIPPVLRFPGF